MKMLVIEDDDRIRLFTSNGLREEGHVVDDTSNGGDGLSLWLNGRYDAVILDLNLPEMDGLSILKSARQKGDATPTIIVSAKKAVDERVEGLRSGADDYLTKPFAFSELLARLDVITRRRGASGVLIPSGDTLAIAGISLDLSLRRVVRDGVPVNLNPKEFALLEFLMRNAGRVMTKEVILRQVWDYRFEPQSNIVDALICRLRNKVDAPFQTALIETRRGVGYVFNGQD
ncbi:MAG: response regulator transcription factor [Kiritimatiellae bacterium]|nr:response regulator transcription factor [Kiritimatiellia bacterium]MDD4025538.1 response regulator transcription factor [Kiritimatiellia bacterium]MDD4621603.1 response regulator transcription factor [Kiritimatiellia bacterium]